MYPALALLQSSSVLGAIPVWALGTGIAVVAVLGLVSLFVSRYVRCPANKVLVISGRVGGGNAARCISGGGTFVWPVVQEYDFLSLEPIRMDVPLSDALSLENIRVSVPSVFTVAVGTEPDIRQNAAMRLLNLTHQQIEEAAHDIIVGQLRQVIASMKIEEINRDRDGFLHRVQHQLEPELKKLGLVLINVNIKDLKDSAGYLEALGRQAAAQAVQQARGDVAEQEKLGEVRVATANREKTVQVAEAEKLRVIGLQENQQEQAVRVAELNKAQAVGEQRAVLERDAQVKEAQREQAIKIAAFDKEQRVAEARASFEREAQIKAAEQERRVAVASAEAKAIDGESQSQALIAQTRSQLAVREAEAYQVAETRKREAEAAVQEAQNKAMARAALAEAERVEAERRAAVEAPAKADKAKTIVEAEAAAERRRIEAEAEARAIFVKLEAEARGQYEIMAKKAEAMRQMVEAAGGAREAYQLLMVEHLDTLAETSAKAISNIKFDKVVVWDGGNGNASSGFLQSMAKTLPPMMHVLRDIAGVELPNYLGSIAAAGDGTEPSAPIAVPPDAPGVPSVAKG